MAVYQQDLAEEMNENNTVDQGIVSIPCGSDTNCLDVRMLSTLLMTFMLLLHVGHLCRRDLVVHACLGKFVFVNGLYRTAFVVYLKFSIPLPGYLLLFSSTTGHYLVDIKKLLTPSIRPIIIAGGLILIYDFFALKTIGLSSTTMPRPS